MPTGLKIKDVAAASGFLDTASRVVQVGTRGHEDRMRQLPGDNATLGELSALS